MSNRQWSLPAFFTPRSIAVVGASPHGGAGSIVLRNLARLGYAGCVYPVNPRYTEVLGHPCYPSLADIPADRPVDCAAILLGSGRLLPALEAAVQRGVQGAWAFASGFAESGEEGHGLQKEVREFCLQHSLMFCGPNCVGYANLTDRVGMYSAPLPAVFETGRIGVIAQSGAVLLALGNSNRKVGFSRLISSGNEAVLGLADYLNYLVDDEATQVIALFIESIREPEAFCRACERAAKAGKPVVALKVGRSSLARKVAATHTGAVAGSDRVLDAVFRRWGVIRVHTLDALLETAVLFEALHANPPVSRRMALCTVSGGEMGMLADLSADCALELPPLSDAGRVALSRVLPPYTPLANPLDAWGSGDLQKAYPASLHILADEPQVDSVVVAQDMPGNMTEEQVQQFADVARAAVQVRARSNKPVMVLSNLSGGLDPVLHNLLREGQVPVLQGSATGLEALGRLADWGAFQRALTAVPTTGPVVAGVATGIAAGTATASPPPLSPDLQTAIDTTSGLVPYDLGARLLRHFGFPLTGETLTRSKTEARNAATQLSYPVALKAVVENVAHKTETGLVVLGVSCAAELDAAYEHVIGNVARHHPGARCEGVLVQQMAGASSVETLVGVQRDPDFGPVVVFGLGGIFVELLQDTRLELAPLDASTARAMIHDLKGSRLLQGFRGRPAADLEALEHLLVGVGRMAHTLGNRLLSLDLNPVMVLPQGQGVRIVDVVIELA